MTPNRIRVSAIAALATVLLLAPGATMPARSQGFGPDPFNGVGEYNSQYIPYLYPTYPTSAGFFPGQGWLEERAGYRQANRFQDYVDELDGAGMDQEASLNPGRITSRRGSQYYRAFRQFDREYDRVYSPNEVADRDYDKSRQERDDVYHQYLREPDPRRRAELYRRYQQLTQRTSRDLATPPRTTARSLLKAEGGAAGAAPADPYARYRRRSPGASSPKASAESNRPRTSAPPPPTSRPAPPPPGPGRPTDVLERSDRMNRAPRATPRPAPGAPAPPALPGGPAPLD
jgi:hypothetical protein